MNPSPLFALLGVLSPNLPFPSEDLVGMPLAIEVQATDTDERTQEEVRILRTTFGPVLRARSRFEDGAWHVRVGREWQVFEAALIREATSVRELEREARKRLRKLDLRKTPDRFTIATWYAEVGMLDEALEHLDVVLRRDPSHLGAGELLSSEHFPLRFELDSTRAPELAAGQDPIEVWTSRVGELLDALASYPPALRELFWKQLDPAFFASENQAPLLMALEGHLTSRTSSRREEAAAALRRLAPSHLGGSTALHKKAVRSLLQRTALDGSEDVRFQAAHALAGMDDPAVAAPLVRALASPSAAVRMNVADALGQLALPATAPALVTALASVASKSSGGATPPPASSIFVGRQLAYLQDFDVEVSTGAAVADPVVNVVSEGAVLDVRLVSAHQRTLQKVNERSALRKALVEITGQDFKYDIPKWEAWLAEQTAE